MRKRKLRTGKNNPILWDEKVRAVPRTDTVTGRKMRFRIALTRWWIVFSLVVAPLSLVGLFLTVNALFAEDDSQEAMTSQQLTAVPGQGEARDAIVAWLDGQGMSGAEVVSWESAQTVPALNQEGATAYAHTFTMTSDQTGMARVTQVVYVSDASGAVSADPTPPALQIGATGFSVEASAGWSGYKEASLTGVSSAVETWARAYASGDSENVRVAVRDGDTTHTYPTISNVDSVATTVSLVGTPQLAEGEDAPEAGSEGDLAVARVQVTVAWSEDLQVPGDDDDESAGDAANAETVAYSADKKGDEKKSDKKPEKKDGDKKGKKKDGDKKGKKKDGDKKGEKKSDKDDAEKDDTPADNTEDDTTDEENIPDQLDEDNISEENTTVFTIDVLLADASTGTPTVVAWGPAGTGPTLTPHQNAYTEER